MIKMAAGWQSAQLPEQSFGHVVRRQLQVVRREVRAQDQWREVRDHRDVIGVPIHLSNSLFSLFLSKAIGQRITRVVAVVVVVVVVVLFHLPHFLFKRNLSEKNVFLSGSRTGVLLRASQALYQLTYSVLVNYFFNLRILVTQHFLISNTRPQTLDQS